MRELIKSILGVLLVIVISAGIGVRYGRKTAKQPVKLIVFNDTTEIVKYDTITRERPVYVTSTIVRHDTVRFATIERDTVMVDVPIERKVYAEDSLYRCVISGYRASLDSLMIYPTETTITIRQRVPAPRWSLGITAGPSVLATPRGTVHGGIGVTAGVSYRF